MTLSKIINLTGLLLDIIGVIGLYFTKIKGMQKISSSQFKRSIGESNMKSALIELYKEINDTIEFINDKNSISEKRTLKYFVLIVIGFLLQCLSQFFCF